MKKSRLLGAVCIGTFAFITTTASAVILPLESRLGGLAYYDSNLNITWVADANAGAGSSFDDGSTTTDGAMTWASADAWVASLTIASVGGWRLPSADVNGDGTVVDCNGGGVTDCFDNEMGYLFWEEGITSAAQFPFANIQANRYWTGTGSASAPVLGELLIIY